MRVAVLGAGAAGLASLRQLQVSGQHQCVVFERSSQVGGTWVYTDTVGTGDDGLPVYTSMYKNLRTNLPKEVMGFPDYPFPSGGNSYIGADDVLNYINAYIDHFHLRKFIKFNHHVERVTPMGRVWEVSVLNISTNEVQKYEFDAIMVCSGHYWDPFIPKIEGHDKFRGRVFHSHNYRVPDSFKGLRVLVIGAGPSGVDVAQEVSGVAEKVYISHHRQESLKHIATEVLEEKPDVKILLENSVSFADGTTENIDVICYATGYRYNFPYLDPECGVTVERDHVKPLYKQLISINSPTMCFIGLPYIVVPFVLFYVQARYFVATLDGQCCLPSKEDMLVDYEKEMLKRINCGIKPHFLGQYQEEYYKELTEMCNSEPLPPVILKLFFNCWRGYLENKQYRENMYRIIDRETFVKIP